MVPQWIPDTKSSHSYTEMLSGGSAFQIFRVTCILNNGSYIADEKTGRMKLSESVSFHVRMNG